MTSANRQTSGFVFDLELSVDPRTDLADPVDQLKQLSMGRSEANKAEVRLSIIVAFCGQAAGSEWLEAWEGACSEEGSETIVVSSVDLETSSRPLTNIRFVRSPASSLVPHLWAAGLEAARGSLIAITTSHFVPAAGYVSAAISAHQRMQATGIGGSITPPFGQGGTAWAIYLLRYSQYLTCRTVCQVEDFAGDNGVYKRAALAPYLEQIRQCGFWEHELHRTMRANGLPLAFDATIEVSQIDCFRFVDFVRQRYRHGFIYGQRLASKQSVARRAFLACRATLVPALLVFRTARNVARARRHAAALVAALPALVCFAAAWGIGEGWGCLSPPDAGSLH